MDQPHLWIFHMLTVRGLSPLGQRGGFHAMNGASGQRGSPPGYATLHTHTHTYTLVCIAMSPGPVHSQAGSVMVHVLDRLHDGAHCSPHRLEQE